MSAMKLLISVAFSLMLGLLSTFVTIGGLMHRFPMTLFAVIFIALSYAGHMKIEKSFLPERHIRLRLATMGILYVLSTFQLWELYASFAGLIHTPIIFASYSELLLLLTGVFEGFVISMFVYLRMNIQANSVWQSVAIKFVLFTIFFFIILTLSMDRAWLKNVAGVRFD